MHSFRLQRQSVKNQIWHRRYRSINVHNPSSPPFSKPKISQFGHAIFNTLTISLTTYLLLNTIWTNLEYYEVENDLKLQSQEIESQIQAIVDEKNNEIQKQRKGWFSFWK
ncbi:uncharacterized protein LODBEIA_P50420 [Lodderomyces beijingensis]|uniref:Uncharacterized protein n=1 Tax=Lodderomyces beijingensis TaxID=1775926 RepID=A0ABP0ZT02_9ASCO